MKQTLQHLLLLSPVNFITEIIQHMKKIVYSLIFISFLFVGKTNAQNFFSNPDFELFSACPTMNGQCALANDWIEVVQSADYINCAYTGWSGQTIIGAQSGTGYMGFATYGSSMASESVGQTLVAPLVTGTSYSITFWAKKSPSGFYSQNCSGVEFYGWVGNPVSGGSSVGVCPSTFPGSFLLGSSAMVTNDLWQLFQVDFTAPANIDFVAMCTGCANCPEYIHVDNFNFVATTSSFAFTTACFGDSTHFTAPSVTGINTSNWNFGDPASGAQNTSALLNPAHLFSAAGTYSVQLILNYTNGTIDTFTNNVTVNSIPVANLGNDTLICTAQPFTMDAQNAGATYLWSTTATAQTLSVNTTGTYAVTVTANNCSASDTIDVTFALGGSLNLGNDTVLCNGNTLTLNALNAGSTYAWSTGETTQTVTVNQTGTYEVQVTNICGTVADSIQITTATSPQVSLGNDTSFCGNFNINYNVQCAGCNYLWSDNSVTPQFTTHDPGLVIVGVSNFCGIASDTVVINASPIPYVTLPNDTMLCATEGYFILATTNATNYLWSTGDTTQSIHIQKAGKYWVDVNNICGTDVDSINITQCPGEYIMPNAFSPNSDGRNDFIFPIRIGDATLLQYDIYNRWGQQVFTYADGDINWDGKYSDSQCSIGVYIYIIRYRDNIYGTLKVLHGNLTLLR